MKPPIRVTGVRPAASWIHAHPWRAGWRVYILIPIVVFGGLFLLARGLVRSVISLARWARPRLTVLTERPVRPQSAVNERTKVIEFARSTKPSLSAGRRATRTQRTQESTAVGAACSVCGQAASRTVTLPQGTVLAACGQHLRAA